jgi:hypothetical protein
LKLPRDLSGDELIRALRRFGYQITRQTGSHIRVTSNLQGGEHMSQSQPTNNSALARSPKSSATSRII